MAPGQGGEVGRVVNRQIMANYGKAFGEPAHKLAVQLAVEQITGRPQEHGYSNDYMQRGHELEPIARRLYESEYFCTVSNGGFFDNGLCGVSPDGLVDDDGVIEIKSVIATQHFNCLKRKRFDPAYKWQLYFNLQQTGRDWIDFVSFCPEFPEGKRLFVDRILKEESVEFFDKINVRVDEFAQLIVEKREVILA